MALVVPCLDASGQPMTAETAATMEAAMAAEGPLTAAELDTLFGPVALFPDQVLTSVLVATTFPLDVVKAGRFVEENAELTPRNVRPRRSSSRGTTASSSSLRASPMS